MHFEKAVDDCWSYTTGRKGAILMSDAGVCLIAYLILLKLPEFRLGNQFLIAFSHLFPFRSSHYMSALLILRHTINGNWVGVFFLISPDHVALFLATFPFPIQFRVSADLNS